MAESLPQKLCIMERLDTFNTGLIMLLCMLLMHTAIAEKQEVCSAEHFKGRCHKQSVIVMKTAVYGRMHLGTCMEVDVGYLGCQNDVLYLVDRWCSGRSQCDVYVPNDELKHANSECDVRGLSLFLEVEFDCIPIINHETSHCLSATRAGIQGNEGYLSSLVTTNTGCGSRRAPWIIEVPSGQTIDVNLLDFDAFKLISRSTLNVDCHHTLGFIVEREVRSNFTICGDDQREKHIYSSRTNTLEIVLISQYGGEMTNFLIQISVIGCSDLTPPAHAWYKRNGNEAVIGCKANDRLWRLYCNGNTWDGVVGNCSAGKGTKDGIDAMTVLPFSSIIFLTCVICGAILLIIIVVVAGAVYVKKQSIRHQIKLRSEYACATLSSTQYFIANPPGYDVTLARTTEDKQQIEDNQPLVQVSDRTLPTRHDTTLVPLTDRPNINSS